MGFKDRIKAFKNRDQGSPTPPKYEFEVVVLKPGINPHIIYTDENMTHEHEGPGDITFKIKPENLFKVSPGILDRIRFRLNDIDSKFMIIFQENEDTPISYVTPKYSAKVLKTVSSSKALSSALKDEFAKAMDAKKFFMYFMLIVGAVVAYVIITGQVNI